MDIMQTDDSDMNYTPIPSPLYATSHDSMSNDNDRISGNNDNTIKMDHSIANLQSSEGTILSFSTS